MIHARIKVDGKHIADIRKNDDANTDVKIGDFMKILTTPIIAKVAMDIRPYISSGKGKLNIDKGIFKRIFSSL